VAYGTGYTSGYGAGTSPTPGPGPSPAYPTPVPTPAVVWTFAAAASWAGLPTVELSEATSRSVTWRLVGNSEAALTLPGLSPQVLTITELISDLWVMRNGVPLFRGRFGASSDAADENSVNVQFGAADYREVLHRRILFEGMTKSYTSADQSAIAWGLVSATQGVTGGNLGIVRGVGATTGIIRPQTDFQYGDVIGERLDSQSQVADGFDFDINPTSGSTALTFDLYYPGRGSALPVVLDYGGRVAQFGRTVDPSTYGNAARGTGADTLAATTVTAAGLTGDPAGRWDLQFSDSAITNSSVLAAKTLQTVQTGQFVQPAWTVTLSPNTWGGPTDFWLGDQVTLAVKTGRLNVTESLRVYEIGLSLDTEDTETITVTLGAPNPRLNKTVRALDRRLKAVERR
jgi:hypothetical protein